jgi:hypothetical protein
MTIADAIQYATAHSYRVQSEDGIAMHFGDANTEYSVWTRPDNQSSFMLRVEETFLDPQFWRALGEALAWRAPCQTLCIQYDQPWKAQWHQFLHCLATGKTAEEFFAQLSPPEKKDAVDG